MKRSNVFLASLLTVGFFMAAPFSARAGDLRDIVFPVLSGARYSDDFGAARSGGRTHEGNDLMAEKMRPLVAAVDGLVRYVTFPEPYYGYAVFLEDTEGYAYWYLHINNDSPGTDDGQGGGNTAFAPDILRGNPVMRGQLLGWVGDSGNAESTVPHLHFEIHRPDGTVINPFLSLQQSSVISTPTIAPPLENEILPFAQFTGGGTITYAELNGRFAGQEIIVGAGPGGGPQVRMYAQDGTFLGGFFAFAESFRGGVDVAAGDFNGDGIDEIIVGAGPGGGPQVRMFTADAKVRDQFMAYAPTFRGGVRLAAADLDGDGLAEIITGAGPGGGPHVRVFESDGTRRSQFFAYADGFRGGIDVSAYPATQSTPALIVTGAGPGGASHVRIFDWKGGLQNQFFAYDTGFRGGASVSIAQIDSSSDTPEILVAPAQRGGPVFRLFSYRGVFLENYEEYEPWWRSGYDIAGGLDSVSVITNSSTRRTSLRSLLSENFFE